MTKIDKSLIAEFSDAGSVASSEPEIPIDFNPKSLIAEFSDAGSVASSEPETPIDFNPLNI